MTAEVITIGDEVLRGEIVDSNKSHLSQRMLALELETARHVSVPDDPGMMEEVLREAAARARVVLVSGGLGPTRDDLTTEVLAATFGRKLVEHAPSLEAMRAFFQSVGREMAPNNAKVTSIWSRAPVGLDVVPGWEGGGPRARIALRFFKSIIAESK